jgi:POT family proton-dependent oligopeptide transporter
MEKQNQTLGSHPKGLPTLFFTEMWERLSYYGMRALLVLYLVKELHFTDEKAGQVYGLYTSLVYLTPILGGFLADRYLGYKKSIYLGSILMLGGHIALALPKSEFFYFGLCLLILGNGFFKPNMSTIVGRLYEDKPQLRDSGYTIFYMGINLGGLIGPIICGSLGEKVDWHYGFGAAGIGMAIGLLVFYFGTRSLPERIWESSNERSLRVNEEDSQMKYKILLILILSVFSILFWMAFEQMGSSMNLFADRFTERKFFHWEIPASFFQSINPLFILCLSPVVAILWSRLSIFKLNPDPILKFVISLALLGVGFLVMVYAAKTKNEVGLVSVWFLFGAYFFNTLSELLLSPVGLSFVSATAPSKYAGMLMGIWFLSTAFGHYIAGFLAGYFSSFPNLTDFFLFFVITSWVGAIVLLGLWFKIRNWLVVRSEGLN